jgi:hypothetical protein
MSALEGLLVEIQALRIEQSKMREQSLHYFQEYRTLWSKANDLEVKIINLGNQLKSQ